MALDTQQVEALQNQTPTDWGRFDRELQDRSSGDANRFKDDDKLHVRFFMAPVIDVEASNKANRAVYRDAEMIEIMMPGEKNNIIRDEVWDQHRMRFPAKYAAFKAGKSQHIGSPLKVLPFLTEARIKELEYFEIHTVEQLAGMADTVKQKFMGGDLLSQKAREWLASFNSGETIRKEMDAKLTEAHAENQALLARIQALEEAQKVPVAVEGRQHMHQKR